MTISTAFSRAASKVSGWMGKPLTFAISVLVVIVWAATGPAFGFSETWQLIINTATTIITFLMVFLIQNSQNRDAIAIQTKLDELIRTSAAQNQFVGIEKMTEEEVETLRQLLRERVRGADADLVVRNVNREAGRRLKAEVG